VLEIQTSLVNLADHKDSALSELLIGIRSGASVVPREDKSEVAGRGRGIITKVGDYVFSDG
jgi:hypothetical protein